MAQVEIFIDYFSQPSRSVLLMCLEGGIDFKVVSIDLLQGGGSSPELKKVSPMRVVPAIRHGEFSLWESHAILVYLCSVFPVASNWFPVDIQERAKVNTYLNWHHLNLRYGCGYFIFKTIIMPRFSKEPVAKDQELELKIIQSRSLNFLEKALKTSQWIAGTKEISIADISCYCELEQMRLINFDFKNYPLISAWRVKMAERPAVAKAHERFYEFLGVPKL